MIAKEIKRYLLDNDMMARDFAKDLDVSPSYLSSILSRTKEPSKKLLRKINELIGSASQSDANKEVKHPDAWISEINEEMAAERKAKGLKPVHLFDAVNHFDKYAKVEFGFYTVSDLQDMLKLSYVSVLKLIRKHKMIFNPKVFGKEIRIPKNNFRAWLKTENVEV